MKVPDIFVPEKNLDEQTGSLEHPKEKKIAIPEEIKKLTDLVIYEGLQPSRFGTYRSQNFSPFLSEDMIDGLFVEYGYPRIEFIQFKNSYALQKTMKNDLPSLVINNSKNIPYYLMIKDIYLGLIYAENKNMAEEIAGNYRERFGFEAHEIKLSEIR
ncbi:hypothetical protein FJZ53_00375 [Candidatus Woesearchaeota archaeon]|nr:hypothetical protein [Candidatus Woesearchaeota archaeon]